MRRGNETHRRPAAQRRRIPGDFVALQRAALQGRVPGERGRAHEPAAAGPSAAVRGEGANGRFPPPLPWHASCNNAKPSDLLLLPQPQVTAGLLGREGERGSGRRLKGALREAGVSPRAAGRAPGPRQLPAGGGGRRLRGARRQREPGSQPPDGPAAREAASPHPPRSDPRGAAGTCLPFPQEALGLGGPGGLVLPELLLHVAVPQSPQGGRQRPVQQQDPPVQAPRTARHGGGGGGALRRPHRGRGEGAPGRARPGRAGPRLLRPVGPGRAGALLAAGGACRLPIQWPHAEYQRVLKLKLCFMRQKIMPNKLGDRFLRKIRLHRVHPHGA